MGHGDKKIYKQRLQNVLIRPGGIRIPDHNGLSLHRRPDTVGNDPVVGKISAADHVSGPAGGNRAPSVRKEGFFIAVGHQLRTGFAVGVGIIAVQPVRFPIPVFPFPVFIHLIRRHIQKRADAGKQPGAFHNMNCSHDIGFIGINRILVGIADNGLRRQMKHDLRLRRLKRLL